MTPARLLSPFRRLLQALAMAAAVAPLAPPAAARPQEAPRLQVLLGYRADGKDAKRFLALRPNVQQEVFVFIRNEESADRQVTVSLLADDAPVLTQKVKADGGNKLTRLVVPRPAAPAAAPGAAPAGGGEKAPPMTELAGALRVRLQEEGGAKLGRDAELEVARPTAYVEVSPPEFFPEAGTEKNRLVVRVRPGKEFAGPPCRVDLVLRPDRIPDLVPGQRRKGVYGGYLSGAAGEELVLVAEDLRFKAATAENGLFYLTVD